MLSISQSKPEILVNESSCIWRDSELDHFKIMIRRDMNVLEMISQKFFNFSHFYDYRDCIFLISVALIIR